MSKVVALKTPKNAQIFVRGPARPHARPHAPAAQNLKNGKYLGYTAPHSRPATGKPTRPIADPKQLSRNRPKSGGSTTHNYLIPAPIIGPTTATRSGIPLSHAYFLRGFFRASVVVISPDLPRFEKNVCLVPLADLGPITTFWPISPGYRHPLNTPQPKFCSSRCVTYPPAATTRLPLR